MNLNVFPFSKFIALISLGLGLAILGSSCYQGNGQDGEKEEIALAVFRYQLTHCRLNATPRIYFLALGFNTDPTDNFMRKFAGSEQTVKMFSKSDYKDGYVIDKETGERGVRLSVTEVKLLANGDAEVKGACFSAFGTIDDQIYSVVKENKEWVVKKAKNILDT